MADGSKGNSCNESRGCGGDSHFCHDGNAFYDDVRQSKEAGMVEHLSKPIQEQELLNAIRRHVKR